ncbi:LamG-like jellyroll fold domain-containing protein [Catenulispora yoronensis]
MPDLWADYDGTLWQFTNHSDIGGFGAGLANLGAKTMLGTTGQFKGYTWVSSAGDLDGDGNPDLWTMANGRLDVVRGPFNGTIDLSEQSQDTATLMEWGASLGVTSLQGDQVAAGSIGQIVSDVAGGPGGQMCVDDLQGLQTDGSIVDMYQCNGSRAQKWLFGADNTIRSVTATGATTACLDTAGGAVQGSLVALRACATPKPADTQLWRTIPSPSHAGHFWIYNPASGMCLDDPGSAAGNHTQFDVTQCTDTGSAPAANQTFALPGTPGQTQAIEAEDFFGAQDAGSTGGTFQVQYPCCGSYWSNGNQLLLANTAAGNSMTVKYDLAVGGTYQVAPFMTKAAGYGTVSLSIDNNPTALPTVFDGYQGSGLSIKQIPFGAVTLGAGAHTFTFKAVNTNPASTGDRYDIGVDKLVLLPASGTGLMPALSAPTSGIVNVPVTADASGSYVGTAPITGYTFDFGDGTAPVQQTTAQATHPYTAAGSYLIKATVTDGTNTVTTTSTITVTTGAVNQWKLNDGSGTTAADTGNTGGAPATFATGASPAPGGYGVFNGTSGSAATAAPTIDTTKSFTVAAWAFVDKPSGYQTIVTQQGSQVGAFHLEYENNGTNGNVWTFARATSDTANTGFLRATSPPGAQTDTWVHLVGSWDATTGAMQLYVNGQLVATGYDAGPIASTGPLVIGRGFASGAANNYTAGGIADVRVYQQAFGSDLASWLYQNSGFTPPTSLTWALAKPTALTSSDGTAAACSTNPASPAVSTKLNPTLGATVADGSWHADFEVRDVTDPTVAAPLYYGGTGASTAAGTSVSLAAPSLINGHEYAYAARAVNGSGAKSGNTASCYVRISVSGQGATAGTGAVGVFLDNTVYPASAGPITWSGPQSNLVWQADGNLMVYTKTGQAIWSSNTGGHPGASLALQSDGNVVIRPSLPLMDAAGTLYGSTLWSSGTAGKSVVSLVVQAGGAVVVETSGGNTFSVSSSTSAGGSTVTAATGVNASYRVGSDGNVWGTTQWVPGGSFGPWDQMTTSGGFTGVPQVIQSSSGQLSLFVRRTDGTLWGAGQQVVSGPFGAWTNINGGGGSIVTDPTIVRTSSGILAAYVTSSDGNIWGTNQYVPGGNWAPWSPVTSGGGVVGRPSVVIVNGLLSVFARMSDGTVWGASQHQIAGPFTGWGNINGTGGAITSEPTIVLTSTGVLAAYVTASDGNVWGANQYVPGGNWTPWNQVTTGGGYVGNVQVIQTGGGLLNLYSRTANGDIYGAGQQAVSGPFGAWANLVSGSSAHFVGDPVVMLMSTGLVAVYAPSADGNLYGTNQTVVSGPFGVWTKIGS